MNGSPVETCTSTACLLAKKWRTSRVVFDVFMLAPTSQDPGTLRHNEKEMLARTVLGMALTPLALMIKLVFFVSVATEEGTDRRGSGRRSVLTRDIVILSAQECKCGDTHHRSIEWQA
jgi:hypothetical protein